MPTASRDRLLQLVSVLSRTTLRRVTSSYGIKTKSRPRKRDLQDLLARHEHVDVVEIVSHVLLARELRDACIRLSLPRSGSRVDLVRRLNRALRWRAFPEARTWAQGLGLQKRDDWVTFSKSGARPSDIPGSPEKVYKDQGWDGWGDWLGTGSVANFNRVFRPFPDARSYARSLGLRSSTHWAAYVKRAREEGTFPIDIPAKPARTYAARGWRGYGDWLGTGTVPSLQQRSHYWSFERARRWARRQCVRTMNEWKQFCREGRKPAKVPGRPSRVYAEQWVSWYDWLGTTRRRREFKTFKAARRHARALGLRTIQEWRVYSRTRRPSDIPSNPNQYYSDLGWKGWKDWLGTRTRCR